MDALFARYPDIASRHIDLAPRILCRSKSGRQDKRNDAQCSLESNTLAGDRDGDDEGVEAASGSPADCLGNRTCMGLGRANEIVERSRMWRWSKTFTGV